MTFNLLDKIILRILFEIRFVYLEIRYVYIIYNIY